MDTETPFAEMRKSVGISQRELGRRAGISSSRMSYLERGIRPTSKERTALLGVLLPLMTVQAAEKARAIEP